MRRLGRRRPGPGRARLGVCAVLVAVGGGVTACGSGHATPAAKLEGWAKGAGFADLDSALTADFSALRAGFSSGDLRALKTACAGFAIDAGGIYDVLPTPDATLTAQLNTALTDFGSEAVRCNDLTSTAPAATASLRRAIARDEAIYDRARRTIDAAGGS